MSDLALQRITQQAETLPLPEYLELIERLVHKLRQQPLTSRQQLDWKPLYGLGKGLWEGEDAQDYVNRLREDRI